MDLRANTAVDVLIGPFVDKTDGNTTEDGLTLTQAEIKLSKNGQALTQKTDATSAAFDDDGYYNCELDATDTDTEGNLVLIVHQSANALPVRHEYNVMAEAAWDSLYAAKDAGFMDVNIKTVGRADAQETEANNLETACANYSATRGLTGTALPAAVADAATGLPVSDAGGLDLDTLLGRLTANVGTEAKQDTAQTDLDTLTGADGATLATGQANYAPSKAGDAMTLAADAIKAVSYDESTAFPVKADDAGATQIARVGADGDTLETLSDQIDTAQTDLDTVTGADGTTLATSQGNYAPAKAGDAMTIAADAIKAVSYDESTAFPVKADDSGATQIARVGADGDTLETLSDQADLQATVAKQDLIKAVTDALTAAGAAKLAAAGLTMIVGTVSWDNTNAITTVFYSDDITEATADHFNGRNVYFTSGALVGQGTDITDYALDTGEGKFTVTALTEAPADNVTFIII